MVIDHGWTAGDLRITRAALRAIEDDARAGYAKDEEACGYLRGPADDAALCDEHVRMVNEANRLHAIDPEQFFRTARTFFSFNGARFDRAVRESAAARRPVKVLYHSHLDAGAYMSPTDQAVMSMGEPPAVEGGPFTLGPGPSYPLAFLVTSVRGGAVDDHKLFVWNSDHRRFDASAFTIID